MTNAMAPDRWVDFLRQEYLESFIPEGGGAIKFVVPLEEETRAQLSPMLQRTAVERGFLTVHVDAETTGVHAIDRIFFRIAEQLPWRELCRRVPGLGLTLDPSHYLIGLHRHEVPEALFPFVRHVRLRDTKSHPRQFQVRVGQGEVEYGKIVSQLQRHDYDRVLTVDVHDLPESPFPVDAEVRKLKYLLESLI